MKKFLTHLFSIVLALFIGAILGDYYNVNRTVLNRGLYKTDISEQGVHYQFINPLLFCADQNISGFTDAVVNAMQKDITSYISQETSAGSVTDVSVYYKDLNNGPNFFINPNLQFAPASLLKVPTAISIYHHAEGDPGFLSRRVTYASSSSVATNAMQYFAPAEVISRGSTYTIEDLVRYMLEDSDNQALTLLGTQLTGQELAQSYADIGLPVPDMPQPAYTLNTKLYASFFRILFNASYLNREDSEHLLSLLSHTSFTQGLVAGVPQDIVVAHKFGELNLGQHSYQLHDCGIIYKSQNPYLLCVMTRGSDYDTLARVIAHISNIVWNTLQNQKNS
jgi:beta-lactamase class A